MNLSALFIRRPVTTTLLLVGILVVGGMAYRLLPISDLPVIDFPTVQVSAGLPGASPETMASSVALPLEKQFSTIAGLTAINSNSSLGNTNITLQFDLSRNIDAAAQDVQAVIAKTTRALPPGMPAPPSLQKQNPTDQPVLYMVLQSDTLPMSLVDEQAQLLAQRLSQVNGVALVNIMGSRKNAVRVDVDPQKLAAHGIGIDEVATAITAANVNLPTGTMYGNTQELRRPGRRPAADGGELRTGHHLVSQRQSGSPRTKSRTSTTAWKTTRPATSSWTSRRSTFRSASSRARTSCRSSTTSRRCCRR